MGDHPDGHPRAHTHTHTHTHTQTHTHSHIHTHTHTHTHTHAHGMRVAETWPRLFSDERARHARERGVGCRV